MIRIAAIALLFTTASAFAQQPPSPQGQQQGQQQERRGPPQEAFDACKGKTDGDTAQMKTPRGDVMSGTCRMVLVPTRPGAERTPPRERAPAK
jgi:hypothetical protein